jgi:methylamine utilization protein MauE
MGSGGRTTVDAVLRLQSIPIALVFAIAGLSKISHPRDTAAVLRAFRLAAGSAAVPRAFALAVAELLLAGALLVLPPRIAGALALVVLAGVTTFVVRQLASGVKMDCGCFGGGLPSVISWATVARNAVVSIPAFLLLSVPTSDLPPRHELVPALSLVGLETCALFLIAAALGMQSVVAARAKDWALGS